MTRPVIIKKGTIAIGLVETTPIVHGGRFYRFEYVRPNVPGLNPGEQGFYRFVDVEADRSLPEFAHGYHCGCACTHGGTMHVFGITGWGSTELFHWTSTDLRTWSQAQRIASYPDLEAFNSSCCHDGKRFVYVFETREPRDVAQYDFTFFFMESLDGITWRRLAEAPPFGRDIPSCGGPTIDYCDGCYYLAYLVGGYEDSFSMHMARSRDLITWEKSPQNPFFTFGEEDRQLARNDFSAEQRDRIARAVDVNASDVEYAEWLGSTRIYYSWGDQRGNEFLAEAESPMPLEEFLRGWFG